MKIPQPNYTQTPNDLFDHWLPHLGEAELKVILVIMRKTFGWHKVRDRISLSQLSTLTGLKKDHVINAAKTLQEKGLIIKDVIGPNGQQQTYYELVIEEDSNNSYQSLKGTPPSPAEGPPPSPLKGPTKEKLHTKEKQQQQCAREEKLSRNAAAPPAAAFSKENSQTQPSDEQIYSCLDDLNLDTQTKIQLTKLNDEDKLIEAVKVYKSKNQPPYNLGAFLQWCCNNDIKCPPPPEDIANENKAYAEAIMKKFQPTREIQLEVLSKHIEFVFITCQKNPIFIEYTQNDFKMLIDKYISDFKFKKRE